MAPQSKFVLNQFLKIQINVLEGAFSLQGETITEYYVTGAESMTDEAIHKYYGNNTIMASLNVNEEEKCYR